jgi:hypothetical protein
MALLRGSTEGMQDADDCEISRHDANSNGYDYGQAENDGHQERDHGQPPLSLIFKIRFKSAAKSASNPLQNLAFTKCALLKRSGIRCHQLCLRIRGFFNLSALTLAASDHPDAP